MSTNLEIESKSLITKVEYERLMKKFSHIKNYTQINYYLMSDELHKNVSNYGLRIRKKNHKFELTLKVTEKVGRLEINQEITRKSLAKLQYFGIFPSGEVKNYLGENLKIDVSKIRIIGKMKTIRKDIKFLDSLISIDKSIYNHITDFEIECEDENEKLASEHLLNFLKQNSIEYQKSEQTKLARFLNTKK